jgi:hypothetical protein
VLRVHGAEAPTGVTADGAVLTRLDHAALDRADRGFSVDGQTVVVKARARRIVVG